MWHLMGQGCIHESVPIQAIHRHEALTFDHVRSHNLELNNCISCLLWQLFFWMSPKEALGTITSVEEFHDPHATPACSINNKWWSHANWSNDIQSPHWTKKVVTTHKPSLFILWKIRSCCLWMSKKIRSTYNTCYFFHWFKIWRIEKWRHQISIGTWRLDFNSSCAKNGPNLFLRSNT